MIDGFLKFFEDFFESEKHHFLNFFPVGLGLGIISYFSLTSEPNFYVNLGIFSILLAVVFFIKSNIKFLVYALLSIAIGFLVAQLRTISVNTYMLEKNFEKPIYLEGTINTFEKTYNGSKFVVENIDCRKDQNLKKVQLTWRGKKAQESDIDYMPGTRVLFCAILSPIYDQAFPGAYDFRKQQYFKGISARGFVVKTPKILKNSEDSSPHIFIEKVRHKIDQQIENFLTGSSAAIAKALITGNTSGISKDIRANFANSGIAHILAISGLHIGIIGFFIFWLFRIVFCCIPKISMYYDVKKISAIISWLVVLMYLYISGRSVPSIRAFFMHTLIIIAILLDRTAFTMRSVAIAATLIMVFTPEVILFPSFQMSFSAVIAIVAFFENRRSASGWFEKLRDTIATTVVASMATTLFSINSFNQLTLNSILANLVAVPLMTFFIMPFAIFGLFAMIFGFAQYPIIGMGLGIDTLEKIAEKAAQLPGSYIVMPTPSTLVLTVFVFSGLLITLIHHKVRNFGWIGVGIGLLCYYLQPIPDIFIAPHAKTVGIRVNGLACFSSLRYFRSMCKMWAQSTGCQESVNLKSKKCCEFVKKINDNIYIVDVKGKNVALVFEKTESVPQHLDAFMIFHLNHEKNEDAEQIFMPSGNQVETKNLKRPWTSIKY